VPDYVVVSASSIKKNGIAEILLHQLQNEPFPFSLTILASEAPQTSGTNRNLAADAAAALSPQPDILSFFDADDVMHPRRCEAIVRAFQQEGVTASALIHGSRHEQADAVEQDWAPALDDAALTLIEGGEAIKRESVYSYSLDRHFDVPRIDFIHPDGKDMKSPLLPFGHITVLTSLWRESGVRFQEENTRCEDAAFVGDIVLTGYSIGFIDAVLSLYIQHNHVEKLAMFEQMFEEHPK